MKPVERDIVAHILARWQGHSTLEPPVPTASPVPVSIAAPAPAAPARPEIPTEANAIEADPKRVAIFTRETRQRLDALRQALNSADTQRATREAHTRTSSSAYFIRAPCAMPRNGSKSDPKADGSPRPNLNRRRSKRRTRTCAPNYGKARLNLRQDIFVTAKFLPAICPLYSRRKTAHGRWHGDCRNPVRG